METEGNGFGLKILLAIFIFISVGLGSYLAYDKLIAKKDDTKETQKCEEKKEETKKEEQKEEKEQKKEESTFSLATESGIVYVDGYVQIEKHEDAINDEGIVDYVYFHITKSNNEDFMKYLKNSNGNSFVKNDAIGLGCKSDGILSYYNSSDANGDKGYKLSSSDSAKLFASTSSKPVRLRLNRLPFTGGSGAPLCYSHITEISIVE